MTITKDHRSVIRSAFYLGLDKLMETGSRGYSIRLLFHATTNCFCSSSLSNGNLGKTLLGIYLTLGWIKRLLVQLPFENVRGWVFDPLCSRAVAHLSASEGAT